MGLPHFDILRHYRQLGGTRITIGSDSHRSEYVQDGAVVLPIDLFFRFSLKKGFLADGDAVDFVDGADDKVEGIAFQKALALRQAVPFHPDFYTRN